MVDDMEYVQFGRSTLDTTPGQPGARRNGGQAAWHLAASRPARP